MKEGEILLSWSAPEYEEKERSQDWFWALGVIAITGAITAIIYSNYFFAFLILLSAGLLWFFALKHPDMVTYTLTSKGVKIRYHMYLYPNIKSFWAEKDHKPTLFIKTERVFMPIISIPIEHDMADQIKNIMIEKGVPEEEMKEHPSEKIMDTLGF